MRRAIAVLCFGLLSATSALAERVAVQSGEHDGFTRLVLDFAAPVGWQMTRTEDGYRLALDRPDMRFDLTDVFRKITRQRLASVWADPESGALTLGIGCACHAFPFELRPDVLVIDLRDGAPPPGSSFEVAADGRPMPAILPRTAARPRERPEQLATPTPTGNEAEPGGYDWLDRALADASGQPADGLPLGSMTKAGPVDEHGTATDHEGHAENSQTAASEHAGDASPHPAEATTPDHAPTSDKPTPHPQAAEALRAEILRQISNGAARGTVELAPKTPDAVEGQAGHSGHDLTPQIRIAGEAGLDAAAGDRPDNVLTAEGDRCLPDQAVDLAAWGADVPVAEAIALRTGSLFGEFDHVDQAAAQDAVRYLLHLGFGAEARGLIETLPLEGPDADLWSSLASVVDGEKVQAGPLTGMEVCDGAVALWAVLARPDLMPGEAVQTGAVLRAFSALPPHLRRHLGPVLAGRFMTQGDTRTVRAIRDAILRPGGDPGPAVRLMEVELGAASGDRDVGALVALQSAPGRTAAAATIAAITAIVAEGGTVDIGLVTATEALLREYKGAEEEPDLNRALAMARASQGDFDAAFAALPESDPGRTDLWALLAERGTDGAVMTHALRGGVDHVPPVPLVTGQHVARRLIDGGFPDAALDWLNAAIPPEGAAREAHLLLAADAELGRRDARAALALIAGLDGPDAVALRQRADLQLGTPEPLDRLRADATAPEALRQQAARIAQDWPEVAAGGLPAWREAATLVAASPQPPDTPPWPAPRRFSTTVQRCVPQCKA